MSARIAILTSQPVVDGVPLYLVAPSVEVREVVSTCAWFPCDDDVWEASAPNERRSRMVPVSLPPSPTMPCPECEGSGEQWFPEPFVPAPCSRCGGSGTVPAPWLIAVEQQHCTISKVWAAPRPCQCRDMDRRQVVVAESPAPDVLPVLTLEQGKGHDGPYVEVGVWNTYTALVVDRDNARRVDDVEPWAANLRPGDTVWCFTPTLLDVPITGRVLRNHGAHVDTIVPFSLVEGQPTEVEV